MKKAVYVMKVADGMNDDYVRVFENLDKAIKTLKKDLSEENIFLEKEDIEEIKERDKNINWVYLYANELTLQKVSLE